MEYPVFDAVNALNHAKFARHIGHTLFVVELEEVGIRGISIDCKECKEEVDYFPDPKWLEDMDDNSTGFLEKQEGLAGDSVLDPAECLCDRDNVCGRGEQGCI
jgi:hypothetical protein